jgi:large subunit ribosomal protein L10
MMKVGKIYRDKVVGKIKDGVTKQQASILVNYNKISSGDISSLRKVLQKNKAKMYSSRNSLVKVALKGTEMSSLAEDLKGTTAFIWTDADASVVSKLLVKFSEKNETFAIRGGVFQKSVLRKEDIKRLADLPAKEVLVAQLLGTLQSPMTRLARTLNGKTTELILILKQLSEKRGGN